MSGWRKSSFSNGTGGNNCVEVCEGRDGQVFVRNSRDRRMSLPSFTAEEWMAFVEGVKAGEFDLIAE